MPWIDCLIKSFFLTVYLSTSEILSQIFFWLLDLVVLEWMAASMFNLPLLLFWFLWASLFSCDDLPLVTLLLDLDCLVSDEVSSPNWLFLFLDPARNSGCFYWFPFCFCCWATLSIPVLISKFSCSCASKKLLYVLSWFFCWLWLIAFESAIRFSFIFSIDECRFVILPV